MHHIHISTSFLFIIALFTLGLVALIATAIRVVRKDRLDAERSAEERKVRFAEANSTIEQRTRRYENIPSEAEVNAFMPQGYREYGSIGQNASHAHRYTTAPVASMAPLYAAAPVYAHDPLSGLATGMILGSAISNMHGHDTTTIIHDSPDHGHSYSSSSDYGSSYTTSSGDSGFSYSDSSSSYDSGSSSGGFDASW